MNKLAAGVAFGASASRTQGGTFAVVPLIPSAMILEEAGFCYSPRIEQMAFLNEGLSAHTHLHASTTSVTNLIVAAMAAGLKSECALVIGSKI